jgi:hypothetical protein
MLSAVPSTQSCACHGLRTRAAASASSVEIGAALVVRCAALLPFCSHNIPRQAETRATTKQQHEAWKTCVPSNAFPREKRVTGHGRFAFITHRSLVQIQPPQPKETRPLRGRLPRPFVFRKGPARVQRWRLLLSAGTSVADVQGLAALEDVYVDRSRAFVAGHLQHQGLDQVQRLCHVMLIVVVVRALHANIPDATERCLAVRRMLFLAGEALRRSRSH